MHKKATRFLLSLSHVCDDLVVPEVHAALCLIGSLELVEEGPVLGGHVIGASIEDVVPGSQEVGSVKGKVLEEGE